MDISTMNQSSQSPNGTFCNSFWPSPVPLSYAIHLVVLIGLASVIAVISNGVLLYSLYRTKQLETVMNKFVAAMSISDLLHSVLVMPVFAVTLTIRHKKRICLLEKGTHFGLYLFAYFSYFMLMCIAFDRFFHIRRARHHGSTISVFQMKLLMWSFAVISLLVSYVGISYISFPFQVVNCVVNVLLISIVFVLYSTLVRKVRIHNRNFAKLMANSNISGHTQTKMDMTATRTMWMLLGTLFFCYAPFNITTPILSYVLYEQHVESDVALSLATTWAYVLIMYNCTINAILFGYGNGIIRRFIMRSIRDIISSETPSSSQIEQIHIKQQYNRRCTYQLKEKSSTVLAKE